MARKQVSPVSDLEAVERETEDREHGTEQAGGRGWHGNPEGHASAGRKGGAKVSQDRAHMAEIGKKGGSRVAQNREHMAEIGRKGGAKVSQDRAHMAEIGKKGGESR